MKGCGAKRYALDGNDYRHIDSVAYAIGGDADELIDLERELGIFGGIGIAEDGVGARLVGGCIVGKRQAAEGDSVNVSEDELAGSEAQKEPALADGLCAVREDGAEVVVGFRHARLVDHDRAGRSAGQRQLAYLSADGAVEYSGCLNRTLDALSASQSGIVGEHARCERELADELL